MATITRESIGMLHDKITVKLSKEDYWPPFEKSLKTFAKQANVPGFRKGMVPSGMVRKMYGQSIFNDEVLRSAGRQLEEYLQQEKLAIFAQPMVLPGGPLKMDMNEPTDLDFNFEIGLKPDFEISPLKNKTALTRYKINVSDKMIEDELERISKRYGTVEEQEEIASAGQVIYATYEACDAEGNVAEDAAKKDDTVLMEKLPSKLQDLLKGKKAGDRQVFQPSAIATGDELNSFLKDTLKEGPDAAEQHFKLSITKVGVLVPKELNAELFAQVFPNDDVNDLEAFKEKLRAELGKEYDRVSRDRMQNEIYELLVHQTPLQLPEQFLKRWMKEGQEKQKSEAEVEHEFPSFDHQLRWTLISDKLIQENGISVSAEEVKNDIKTRVLAYFGMQGDDDAPWMDGYMQKMVKDEKTMDETYRRLLFDRLFQWLETQFAVHEKDVAEEEFFKLPDAHAAHHHH